MSSDWALLYIVRITKDLPGVSFVVDFCLVFFAFLTQNKQIKTKTKNNPTLFLHFTALCSSTSNSNHEITFVVRTSWWRLG